MSFIPFTHLVQMSLSLVSFGDSVPVRFVGVDAVLLHPSVNEFILPLPDFAEMVEVSPQLNVEAVTDYVLQSRHSMRRQIVEHFRRSVSERRHENRHMTGSAKTGRHV